MRSKGVEGSPDRAWVLVVDRHPRMRYGDDMFELTDDERESVGLDRVAAHWRRVAIGGVTAFFDGDILRKYLHADASSYLEVDTELATHADRVLLPRTAKGKEKALTPAVLLVQERAKGRWFQASFSRKAGARSMIRVLNTRNMRRLHFWNDTAVTDGAGLRRYLTERATALDADDQAEMAAMKAAPRQRVTYAPGDVFRFRMADRRHGFALILGCLKDIRKWGVLPDEHPLNSVMTVPLIVRAFRYGARSSTYDAASLTQAPLLPARLMMDDQVFWGDYPIVGHRPLEEDDVDFPMGYGLSPRREKFSYFYWGFGLHKNVPPTNDPAGLLCGRAIRRVPARARGGRVGGRLSARSLRSAP